LQACITEDQKYQGKLYKEKKPNKQNQKNNSQALTPHNAYVEDARDDDNAIAVVDAPPRAPTPPPAAHSLGYHEQAALPNVFDFLDPSQTPNPPKTHAPINESRMLEDSQPPVYEEQYMPPVTDVMKFQVPDDDESFAQNGFTYGSEHVRPSRERYDSYTTPAPKPKQSRTKSRDDHVESTTKKSDRKRKRSPTELNMSLVHAQEERDAMMAEAPPMLHSGLTGGLNKLLACPEFPPSPEDSGGYVNSPLSPLKRAKQGNSKALQRAQRDWEAEQQKQRKADVKAREKAEKKEKDRGRDRKERKASTALVKIRPKKRRDDSGSNEVRRIRRRQYSSSVSPAPRDRKAVKAIEYNRSASNSPEPDGKGQLIVRPTGELAAQTDARAALFMSFISKGPDSERGMSVNKALKRFHRERHEHNERVPSKSEEEKELWKDLRLKRNDRGEVVLFFAPEEAS
jgi:cell growth-regulating nucleolar protein